MNVFERWQVGLGVLRFEIDHLAANHAIDSSRAMRDLFDDAYTGFRRTLQTRKNFIGLSLQSVAGEDSHGFAEYHMTGRPATPQVIVVEGRKVVVNERVGVQHFERGAQVIDSIRQLSFDHAPGLTAQDRTQALSARE